MNKLRILVVADEEWNDCIYGNGILTNWFTDFNADFAEIYCSPGLPINNICNHYFRLTDLQMFRSIFTKYKAGSSVIKPNRIGDIELAKENVQRKGFYGIMKRLSVWFHTPIMMIRDFVWRVGRYDKEALSAFIFNFNPDIIFCPQYGTPKLWRLERYIHSICDAPMVAFTGDDEISYKQVSYSPLYWIRRWYCRQSFNNTVHIFSHYFMHSKEQAEEYRNLFGINTSQLFKCGYFSDIFVEKPIGNPIRLVYAGRLYCNRWKSLAAIGKALREINKDGIKMVLDVYTQEQLTKEQERTLNDENFIFIKGAVPGPELTNIYKKADIALHVESFDKRYKYATRVSFSTKIVDLMASSCAILAICWEKHCGYQYLKDHDAAICCSDYDDILPLLQSICDDPSIITKYQERAYNCGVKRHSRSIIQNQIIDTFQNVLHK